MTFLKDDIDGFIDAAARGQLDEVKRYVKAGMDINARCPLEGDTVLNYAASADHLPLVKWLLKNNADPNLANDSKETALHYATFNGSLDIMAALLHGKANPDLRNEDGMTPLVWAARRGASLFRRTFGRHVVVEMEEEVPLQPLAPPSSS